ncbi:Telomere repeat-binding protein 4 [Linum grandiflorum]
MVLKKRQHHGISGFHFPFVVPKAPRSARRGFHKRIVEDSQLCAFELLASLAGKLLMESESSSASSNASGATNDLVKREQVGTHTVKTERFDLGSCEESIFLPNVKETPPPAESDSVLERFSTVSKSDSSVKVSSDLKPLPAEDPALINLDSNVKLGNSLPSASGFKHGNAVKSDVKDDDDENLFRSNKQSSRRKAFRPSSRIGDRRIRKLLSSKYWRSAPKLKDYELTRPASGDGGMTKPLYHKRKLACNYDRRQYDILYKRRKLSDRSLVIASDVGFSSESVCNSPEKGMSGDNGGSEVVLNRATIVLCAENGHQGQQLHSKDSHVKLSIKSFKIPELLIEVPETATVGSLKRTIVEAVSAILGGGLRVGVIHHGKKVRDDNRTLLQTGISSSENLDSLGFTLEPSSVQAPAPLRTEEFPAILPSNTSQLVSRSPTATIVESQKLDKSAYLTPLPLANLADNINTNQEQEPLSSNADTVMNKSPPSDDSKALVAVEPPLAVLPLNQKCRRSENVQRRTRRPFSVSEVEALVHAVEELGTGRWRDVKLRSFDNADHRTYVDLKDKWKTLVHTAKIAPQQRRGEPVPQDLLDRVLAAHGYWSQHQARQQTKIQAANATAISAVLQITDGSSRE